MSPDHKLRIANAVAMRHGLKPLTCDAGTECEFEAEDGDSCSGCNVQMVGKPFYVRTSYECDEGDYYCSRACASRLQAIGERSDYLERMGWTLWHGGNAEGNEWRWAKFDENYEDTKPVAREGDGTWHADCEVADALAREFRVKLSLSDPISGAFRVLGKLACPPRRGSSGGP